MLELLFALIIIGVVVYLSFRILHNVAIGILIIFLVIIASYLMFGALPDLKSVPVIGKYLPSIPSGGEAIAKIKNIVNSIEILGVNRDSQDHLLVTVANTGKLEASNFTILVDNHAVGIINNPKDPLKSGQITVIQTDWTGNFTSVQVQTEKASDEYKIS